MELPIIVPRANCTSNTTSPRNQHCFPSHSTFRLKKRKRKRKESSCLRWTEVGFSVGMFTKNWHPLQTMAPCHRARVTFHLGFPCGMCAAWDSYQGMTDLWQHCGPVPSKLGGGHGWLLTIKWHRILNWNQCWDESKSIGNIILDHFQAGVFGLKGISAKTIFIFSISYGQENVNENKTG